MGLFHGEIMTALTCFAGITALCQAGESRDAELPSPPNIKGNEAVPMGLVLLSGHSNVASELSFEEPGNEVQWDPQELLTSAKQGFISSVVQPKMSQNDCQKSLANIIGMNKKERIADVIKNKQYKEGEERIGKAETDSETN
ncbi:hypothetical protein BTVI_122219 [Pitangus sulphuratus]|nr:hypothetical protein BTVI_122219 [Pitangus sulphuratus]